MLLVNLTAEARGVHLTHGYHLVPDRQFEDARFESFAAERRIEFILAHEGVDDDEKRVD